MDRTAGVGADPAAGGQSVPASSAPPGPGPTLTAEQQAALDALLQVVADGGQAALQGAAGTGKSTVTAALLRELSSQGQTVLGIAPTHKALRVLGALAGDLEGVRLKTLASVLRMRPRLDEFGRLEFVAPADDRALKALEAAPPAVVIVDEASMVAQPQADQLQELTRALGSALLLVGDPHQLPPVAGKGQSAAMASQFLQPEVLAKLTTVVRHQGPVLQLATALRQSSHPSEVWPSTSSADTFDGQVVVHRRQSTWLAAAVAAIGHAGWDADPDSCRVLSWSNRTADAVGAAIRRKRYGRDAIRWNVGEILSTPRGVGAEGDALGGPQAEASAEFRVLEVSAVQRLEDLRGSYRWATPAKKWERALEITAAADAQRLVVEHLITGAELEFWAELPGSTTWAEQCKAVRKEVLNRLSGSDRREALKACADLAAMVPMTRPACSITLHQAQGSSFSEVFLDGGLRWCTGSELMGLAYVGATRPRHRLHLLPWSG